ncbi:hypothetical protein ANCDUO_01023 [Ancylostoma duodenale]|uniref:Uncharacterized protein n=1 Tax=Ancylostoma duodenale TaxID=51022 RepID=A0A0C2DZZ3_9BILA|nr:hypothetical protein ANCDUO_01023 [Ancylostoma duodenale]
MNIPGKRPRDAPRKRWMNAILKDMKKVGVRRTIAVICSHPRYIVRIRMTLWLPIPFESIKTDHDRYNQYSRELTHNAM